MTDQSDNNDSVDRFAELVASGSSLVHSGRYAEAEVLLRRALALEPTSDLAIGYLAIVEIHSSSDPNLLAPLDRLILENPDDPFYRYCRALENYRIKNDEQFLEDVSASIGKLFSTQEENLYVYRSAVLHEQGKYEEALIDTEKALALDPNRLDAHYGRARARNMLGDYSGALEDLNLIANEYRDDSCYNFNLGIVLCHLGKHQEAVIPLSQCIEPDDGDVYARIHLASSLAILGRYDEAMTVLFQVGRRRRFNLEDLIFLGALYFEKGCNAQAIRVFKKVVRIDPGRADAWFFLAACHPDEITKEEVVRRLGIHIEQHPPDAAAYYYRAISLPLVSRAAIKDLTKALQLNPDLFECRMTRAIYFNVLCDFDRAHLDVEILRTKYPTNQMIVLWCGILSLMSGNLDSAQADLDDALRMDPKLIDVYMMRAFLKARKGKYAEALNELAAIEFQDESYYKGTGGAVRSDSTGFVTLTGSSMNVDAVRAYVSALILVEAGDRSGALERLGVAIEKDSNYKEARLEKAWLASDVDADSRLSALEDLDLLMRSEAKWPAPYFVRGMIRLNSRLFREAELDFKKALEMDPDEPQAIYLLGLCNIRMGRLEEARRLLIKSSEFGYQAALDALRDMKKVTHEVNGEGVNVIKQGPRKRKEMQVYVDAYLKTIEITLKPQPSQTDLRDFGGIPQSTWVRVLRTKDFHPMLADALIRRSKVFEAAIKKVNARTEGRAISAFERRTITHIRGSRDGSTADSDSNEMSAIDATHSFHLDKDEENVADQIQKKVDFERIQKLSEKDLRAEIRLNRPEYPEEDLVNLNKEELEEILAEILGDSSP